VVWEDGGGNPASYPITSPPWNFRRRDFLAESFLPFIQAAWRRSDEAALGNGNGEEELKKARELAHGLQASSGMRFEGAAPIAPSGWKLEKEAPWHRLAAFMYAMGAIQQQISRELNKSLQAVCNLTHQPFFQEKVIAIMAETARVHDVIELFKAETLSSLATLVEIRDNPKAPASARVDCARDILDRTLGKAVQRVETAAQVTSEDPVAEVARLESEVKRLREEA
jgi:hypothetical protein